jgi:hypothetical protein
MSAAKKTPEERVHAVKCMHCTRSGAICTGKEGIVCMPCRDCCKGCKYTTHRCGGKSLFFSFLVYPLLMLS